jgi:hypothetical protein
MAPAPEAAPEVRLANARVTADGDEYGMTAAALTLGIGMCAGFGWLAVATERRRRPRPTPARVRR